MPHTLDAEAVREWCGLALEALGRARADIDAINVYPVADGDTGTNLYLTAESAAQAVEAAFDGHAAATGTPSHPTLADAVRAMAHGALIGARGNSGTILAQLLRGMADVMAAAGAPRTADPRVLKRALRHAAESAYAAVAHPVEGTVLTVAAAAADAAERAEGDTAAVARAAHEGARGALDATPDQLEVLARAGVVDAGGSGLVAVLGALAQALSGATAAPPRTAAPGSRAGAGREAGGGSGKAPASGRTPGAGPAASCVVDASTTADAHAGGPAFEVIYLLEAEEAAVDRLRARLDALGDCLVVVGGDGLWNVHVHVDDAGAAVEAGVQAGRPYRIRITHFGAAAAAGRGHGAPGAATAEDAPGGEGPGPRRERAPRAVVAVVPGAGLAALHREAGAVVVATRPGEPPVSGELVEAIRRAHAHEVVVLPNDATLQHTAAAAAEQARTEGVRVALIPTRSAVQGIAALAVHEPGRRFDEDVVAMTAAAGATRHAELVVAEHQSWTMAGVCQAGDVLGLIDGDVAVIGRDLVATARTVLDRMLAAGGELVTLVLGEGVPDTVSELLTGHVREGHLAVDTVAYRGEQQAVPLIIGIE
ncbi:DAK2 domain-containing protein [Streptomyces sp. SAJ15]|uniref:DAK2 domain-containing protein n=1 Tax=Streptomyces sp. SAJ15 TaxID=2011095 RepID=UPI001185B81E|nr:DAK2 domain-containing protein [Streptomyces sp. SAJ15]TVL94326.1 dihydroxyacetone kinase [Streptomyces sp. SAJ15]